MKDKLTIATISNIEARLQAVKTLDDLRRVLIEVRTEKPRVLDMNALLREQHEAERLIDEQFPGEHATASETGGR